VSMIQDGWDAAYQVFPHFYRRDASREIRILNFWPKTRVFGQKTIYGLWRGSCKGWKNLSLYFFMHGLMELR
jgi:hypothetical protein